MSDIEARVKKIIAEQLGVEEGQVTPEKAFVADLPRTVRIGVVSFAGTAAVVQAPTFSREDVVAAIDRFQLQRGTATGSGIILSLAASPPVAILLMSAKGVLSESRYSSISGSSQNASP